MILGEYNDYRLSVLEDQFHRGKYVGQVLFSDQGAILQSRGHNTTQEAAWAALEDFMSDHPQDGAELMSRSRASITALSDDRYQRVTGAAEGAEDRRSLPRAPRGSKIAYALFRREDGWTVDKARRWLGYTGPEWKHVDVETMESEGGERLDPGDYILVRIAPKSERFDRYGYGHELKNNPGVWLKFGFHGKRKAGEHGHAGPAIQSVETKDARIVDCGGATIEAHRLGDNWGFEPALVIFEDGTAEMMGLQKALPMLCDRDTAPSAHDHLGPDGRYFVDFLLGEDEEVRTTEPFTTEEEALTLKDQMDVIENVHVTAVYEADRSGRAVILWEAGK